MEGISVKKYASTFVFFCLISTLTVALNGCGGSGGSGDPDNKDDAPKPATGFNSEQTVGSLSFDFEHSSQSWSSYGVITSTSPNYARSGSSSLAITQRQANDYGTKRRIHQAGETLLQAGRTYIIRGYLKQPNASDNRVANLELLNGSGNPYDSNLAYDIHIYDPWDSFTNSNTGVYRSDGSATTGSQELLDLIEEHRPLFQKYPFSIGEFGQKNDDYFSSKNALGWINDLIDLLDERHIGYQYFSYKGNEFGLFSNDNNFSANSEKNTALVNALKQQLQPQ